MTPADLQNKLIDRIREVMKNFPLSTTYNDGKPFNIFKQDPPEQMSDEMDYSPQGDLDSRIYPFVCVQLHGGEKSANHSPQDEVVFIMIGTHNEDLERKGFDDAVAAAQVIMNDLNANTLVDARYSMKYPLKWKPFEENTYPHFFVGIELAFELLTITDHGGMDNGNW